MLKEGGGVSILKNWRRRPDSNRCIGVLQTPALTTWLRRPLNVLFKPTKIFDFRGTPFFLERKMGFEPTTLSLARRCSTAEPLPLYHPRKFLIFAGTISWCRGGDLNSYELTLTTPSRWRVYRFHHLGLLYCFSSFSLGKHQLRHPRPRRQNLPKMKESPRMIRMAGQV